jgi:5-(carboxyamino)imidazole ribonucleotide synthase
VACVTSQFEQAVRSVCDLPLGSVEVARPAALVNLLGDLWLGPRPPAFEAVLALPGIKLSLYGKQEARPGRKMGHLCAIGADPVQAVERAQAARALLA